MYENKTRMIPEPAVEQSPQKGLLKSASPPHKRRESRSVCVCVCSAGFRQRPEHVDIKALLINTIRFSWELRSAFRVQDCGA